MPSKTKKQQSKGQSRLSNSDFSASSPRTPSFTPSPSSQLDEEDVSFSLGEASSRFPHLIDKSALVGRITDVVPDSRGGKIWLSESSMVASSILPGSVVSVSVAASASNAFPLREISSESSTQLGLDSMDELTYAAGNYFALATAFPSCKVVKTGVRLSTDLWYTMGCPVSDTVAYIYPIDHTSQMNQINKRDDRAKLCISHCNELYLDLAPLKDRVQMISGGKPHDSSANGVLSSPRTPSCQTKQRSPSSSGHVASPKPEEAGFSLSYPQGTFADSFEISEVLKDENAKKLLQVSAASWLCSRILICGNLVAIPVMSELVIFRVTNYSKFTANDDGQAMIGERNSIYFQKPKLVNLGNDAMLLNHETQVYFCKPENSADETPKKRMFPSMQIGSETGKSIRHDVPKLGGLCEEYAVLRQIITFSMDNTLSSLGLRAMKGVLLHGPPGTGKTSLARLCAHDAAVKIFTVNGPEIISQYQGESEQAMREVFDSASQAVPAMVFIDELDAIAPARKEGGDELSQRMVATLLNLMDGISRTDGVLIVAATNRPDSIDPALRRPGRLDREIEIGVPSAQQRLEILQTILGEMEHLISDLQAKDLAMTTHGFVGADLAALCNEAALVCLRRYSKLVDKSGNNSHFDTSSCADSGSQSVSNLPVSSQVPASSSLSAAFSSVADNIDDRISNDRDNVFPVEEKLLKVVFEDFEKARTKVRPSAMREVILEVPKVKWEDIGGQREVKAQLIEAVEWPQKHQDAFQRIGIRPPSGILMFGPPGCSKTLMARAVASEAGLNFFAVKGPELFSKWVGESEKAVKSLFAKARANAPSIIFFDEIDALAVIRGKESDGVSVSDRVMAQLLGELDGLHQRVNVTVIAATNRPDKIDPALLRPGRFDRLLYVGPPNETDREAIFSIHLRKHPCSSDINMKQLASLTHGYTGADISFICHEAAIAALAVLSLTPVLFHITCLHVLHLFPDFENFVYYQENIDALEVTMRHLKHAIGKVNQSQAQSYEMLSARFQRLVQTSNGEDESI
ncbi:unnamed protein product [Linum tenue]|uniref:AAA+ ATPase domain-containing protein n=1 Tax=Linum tenue TaxID=586396 RepID=A0AAV0LH52_9ROSI|nr:unnamed protein product [Linum tenue]